MKRHLLLTAVSLMLSVVALLQTHAADNTWQNGTANFTWDLTSANWTSPTIWADGDDAIFGATGAGTVGLGAAITAQNLTFTAPGYVLEGNGNALTVGNSEVTITANAGTSNHLAVSILGTNGVTFDGTGTTVLAGDAVTDDANHYTGASYFRSGTVILQAAGAGNGAIEGDSHAVESIEALDTGATLQFGTTFDGSAWVSAPGEQIGARIPGTKMIMTGGTLDLNNDPKNEVIRVPDGFGLIINNGSSVQAGLNVIMDGLDHTYSGLINDGNDGVLTGDNYSGGATPQGPGYQIGIVSISSTTPGSTWTLAGDNTYSGSTRIDGGTTVKLAGNHSLGIPTLTNSLTGPMRLTAGSAIDFNGRDQTIALMTDSGAGTGIMYNSAVGTVSTLTVGYGNENAGNRACSIQFMDNTGVGGKFAFRKIMTQPYTYYQTNIGTGEIITNVVTTCLQTLKATCVATYSGDTSIDGGTLQVLGPTAISPNSAYRLSTNNYANLWLNYDGDAPCRQLWINGVQQPNGTYGAGTPGIDPTSTGTITVTGASLPNTWNNGTANFTWDLTSANWTSPAIWAEGDSSIFGATGAGTVTLGGPITVQNQTFNAAGYTIAGGGNPLTLAGTTPTITVNADSTNAVSLQGTNGLTVQGTGVLTLLGDTAAADGNHYTGGTYVRSGTLVLAVQGASSDGSSYGVDSIEALDAGATLVIPGIFNGTSWISDRDQIATSLPESQLKMTGGTLDMADDPKNQRIPVPDGSGLIINSGSNVQSGLIMVADGVAREFSGVIADGNNGVLVGDNNGAGATPQGPGYQIGIVSFAGQKNGGGGLWTLSGSNTYSGSTRIDQGASIKLVGNGTIGFPTASGSLTGPMRIYGSASDPARGYLDLNGHNQTIALMQNGNTDAKIFNSAVGTVSTLTIGYGNEQVARTCSYQLMDNQGTGGIFALKKVATGPAFILPSTGLPATNCTQILSGVNTYSGDTTVAGGHLIMAAASAVSSNSAFHLSTTASQPSPDTSVSLALMYDDTANVRQLWIDGVQQPNGVYGAGTPGINPNSTGTLTVTGYSAPPTLGVSQSGSGLTFTWTGSYKLQAQTNSLTGTWYDYPGGNTSPVAATIDPAQGSVYFRLSE